MPTTLKDKVSTMARYLPNLTAALVTALVLLFAACGGDSGTGPNPPDETEVTIGLGSGTGAPLGTVTVTGLPTSADPADLWAEVTDPVTGSVAVTFVTRDQDTWSVLVPPHPSSPFAGGPATVRITDGGKLGSNLVTLDIAPLPAATGAFTAAADALSGLLTSWLAAHGTSRAELDAADPGQLTGPRAPLYLAYEAIDMPANPNALRAVADGTSPLIAQFGLETAHLDAAFGACGFGELLALQQARADSLAEVLPAGGFAAAFSGDGNKDGQVSAAELDQLMWKAQLASILNNPNGQQILQRTGQAMAVVGLHPEMKAAALGLGVGLFGYTKSIEAAENLYPSHFLFSEDDLVLSPSDFPEDEDQPGTWTLNATAESKGWTVDRAVLEGLVQYLGAGGLGNAQGRAMERFMTSQLGQDFAGMMVSEGMNAVIGGQLASPQDGQARIEPSRWTADVSAFCNAQVVDGTAVVLGQGRQYTTNEVGTARIRVAKQDGRFGYQGLLRFKPVVVNAIEVSVSPTRYDVTPGDLVYFFADVQNANDTTVRWSASVGSVQADGLTGIYQTPTTPWSGAITIEAESAATGGLRATGQPRRFDSSVIYCDQVRIIVSPDGICIGENDQVTFSAEVTGYDEPYEIEWSATAGSFTGDLYTAPGSPLGEVAITAAIAGTEHEAYAVITVGGCECSWSADLFGALSGTVGGDFAVYESYTAEGGESGTTFYFRPGAMADFPNFYATLVPALGEAEIGSRIALTFYVPDETGQSQWLSLADDQIGVTLPVLTVTANDGDLIQGTLSGDLVKLLLTDPPEVLVAGFNMEFRARRQLAPGDNPCQ